MKGLSLGATSPKSPKGAFVNKFLDREKNDMGVENSF